MWKLGMAMGLCWLAGCSGAVETVPAVEPFAAHQVALWPAGKTGTAYVYESASGFLAYGETADGKIAFVVSGSPDEIDAFDQTTQRETGIAAKRCGPQPSGETPIPCPPGPTGQGGGSGSGGGQTHQ
jgi:hypothetical protein